MCFEESLDAFGIHHPDTIHIIRQAWSSRAALPNSSTRPPRRGRLFATSRETERGAKQFPVRLAVRSAPFALRMRENQWGGDL
jgi:hypothetical protein